MISQYNILYSTTITVATVLLSRGALCMTSKHNIQQERGCVLYSLLKREFGCNTTENKFEDLYDKTVATPGTQH